VLVQRRLRHHRLELLDRLIAARRLVRSQVVA
jgi:hypothetical protein